MEQENENIEQVIDEKQEETLDEIVNPENMNKIKLKIPKNEFIDETIDNTFEGFSSGGSISSGSENAKIINKYGYTFNINGFESNSIAYFNEILLNNKNPDKFNCFNVDFNFADGKIFTINKSTFNYLKMVMNSDFDLQGDIDGVITNVPSEVISNAKKENPYNIFTSDKFLKEGKTYDIFCESTFGLIDKLTNKKSNGKKKVTQLKKLIFIIELIQKINKEINDSSSQPLKELKKAINKHFHHQESNEIIMSIIVDGNYKKLIERIKTSCLFAKQWKNYENPEENRNMKKLYDYFELLRKSKVPFLIIYCPRFYERTSKYYNPLSKQYIEDDDIDTDNKIFNLESENAFMKQKIKDQDNKLKEQDNKIKEQDNKIKALEEKINNLLKDKDLLGRKKIRTKFKAKKSKGKKTEKKRPNEGDN